MTDTVRIEVEHLTDPTGEVMVIDSWESYEIESDMMAAADSFTLRVQPRKDYIDFFRIPGHVVRLYIGDSLQMTGIIEATPDTSDTGGAQLQLTGRDFGGLLNDSAAPLLDLANLSLLQIAEKLLEPWAGMIPGIITDYKDLRLVAQACKSANGFTSAAAARRTANSATASSDAAAQAAAAAKRLSRRTYSKSVWGALNGDRLYKYPTSVGGSVWSILESLAGFIGVHVWMAPDGHVVIARPEYQQTASGKLFVHIDDDGNLTDSNCTATRSPDIGDRFCDYALVGQGYSGKPQKGKDLSHYAAARDPSRSFWYDSVTRRLPKTKVESVKSVQAKKFLTRKARTMAEEKIVRSYGFTANVEGHRTTDVMPYTNDAQDIGPLWAVDTVVDVDYQPKAVSGPHYIIRREFKQDIEGGKTTDLTPIPSDIWLATDHDMVSDSVWTEKLRSTMEFYAL